MLEKRRASSVNSYLKNCLGCRCHQQYLSSWAPLTLAVHLTGPFSTFRSQFQCYLQSKTLCCPVKLKCLLVTLSLAESMGGALACLLTATLSWELCECRKCPWPLSLVTKGGLVFPRCSPSLVWIWKADLQRPHPWVPVTSGSQLGSANGRCKQKVSGHKKQSCFLPFVPWQVCTQAAVAESIFVLTLVILSGATGALHVPLQLERGRNGSTWWQALVNAPCHCFLLIPSKLLETCSVLFLSNFI